MALPSVVKKLAQAPHAGGNLTKPSDSHMAVKPHMVTAPKSGGGPRPGTKKVIQFANKAPSVAVKKVG